MFVNIDLAKLIEQFRLFVEAKSLVELLKGYIRELLLSDNGSEATHLVESIFALIDSLCFAC